jgi:DNA-binding XRE family transcriptional regulator
MVHGKNIKAHRFSYELHHGPIPDGLLVRHKCDNPPCVNPDHLEVGTKADNGRDMMERNRYHYFRGSDHHAAKVTEQDVRVIRQRIASGVTCRQLAAEYGVNETTISAIKRRRTWNHLD